MKVNVKYKIKKEQFINGSGETEFRYFFVRDLAPKIKELILKKIRINWCLTPLKPTICRTLINSTPVSTSSVQRKIKTGLSRRQNKIEWHNRSLREPYCSMSKSSNKQRLEQLYEWFEYRKIVRLRLKRKLKNNRRKKRKKVK